MLTADDAAWIASNRAELLAGRTESITIYHRTEGAADTYTGEPSVTETAETVYVVWKPVDGADRDLFEGIELLTGDFRVTFGPYVTIADVKRIVRGGIDYAIIAVKPRGLGGTNRLECIVRRVI
ncbi:hypothetical protein [Paenibacillus abyssi]|uniref:Head-tail adaptor protein n=1 Tax=Paenibacillus abyssi TaxID=1340531 RepID=A0A917CKF6_9BACL|nr:hypothetical protein [Paenibacillus abyssi]GGF88462.1 hypothetical protein GCM10010916_02260 [Paenibacillus abyssi]